MLLVPVAVGVPVIDPCESKLRPAGRAPAVRDQVTVPVPPVEWTAVAYVVPTIPFGKLAVVIASVAGLMEMVRAFVAVCAGEEESVAFTVKLLAPAVVGVPLIVPVLELRARPAGREPTLTDQVIAPVPPEA